jgi:hypothetical protein
MQNWSNWCHYRTSTLNKVAPEFLQRTHPIHSIGPKTNIFGRFGPFGTARKSMQNWTNWCHYRTCTLNKVAPKFSHQTHSIHSIGPKTHVLGRLGPFRYSTKFDAKLAEMVDVNPLGFVPNLSVRGDG